MMTEKNRDRRRDTGQLNGPDFTLGEGRNTRMQLPRRREIRWIEETGRKKERGVKQ